MQTSAVAKMVPTNTMARVISCTGRRKIAAFLDAGSFHLKGGSVARCSTNAAVPKVRRSVEARIPASANSPTLRPTDSEAPAMYTSSSAADSNANAVFSCGRLRNNSVHRALTIADMLGIEAANSAVTNRDHAGHLWWDANISRVKAMADSVVVGTS